MMGVWSVWSPRHPRDVPVGALRGRQRGQAAAWSLCRPQGLDLGSLAALCWYSRPLSLTQAKTKGLQSGVDIGVKYSEKQERNFDDATMKAGQCVIGLQVGDSSPSPRDHGVGGPRCWGTAALGDSGMEPCSPSISGRDRKLVGCSLTSPTNLPADGHQQMRQPVGHDRVRHEEASL